MSFRDILALLLSDSEESAVRCAQSLAQRVGGKASALLLEIEPAPIYLAESAYGYVSGDVWVQLLKEAHEAFLGTEERVKSILAALKQEMPLRKTSVSALDVERVAALQARYADVTVMARAGPIERRVQTEIFESALFGSGRPIVLTPSDWRGKSVGQTIALGWNAKREAARALTAAGPLIDRAEKVVVVTVDAKPSWKGHGDEPGADIAAHLARRGLNTEVRNIQSNGRDDGTALMQESVAAGADLLVIGGYGHSRLEEFVLGGVTRELLHEAPIPLFMAH